MRCNNCNAIAKIECCECHVHVCRLHHTMMFDEKTRSFSELCGACYAQKRAVFWVKEKY